MKSIVIGQYVPGKGFLYHADPRTKILSVLFLLVAVFLLESLPQLGIALAIAIIVLLIAKLSLIRILKGLKPILVLLIFTFIFQLAFNKSGEPLLSEAQTIMTLSIGSVAALIVWFVLWRIAKRYIRAGFLLFILFVVGLYFIQNRLGFGYVLTTYELQFYSKGVEMSIFVVIRLLIVITLSTVLTLTTKPTDLTQGLESLMRPLKIIGINSEDFALIISISLRYIPTILDEANKIMLAQASRGADFSEGKLKDKVKQVISLLVPMFIIAFKRSEDLADAMESRNFVPGRERTRIHELRFNKVDFITVIFVVIFFTSSILVRVL
jgi:energy-coupling factor transport system permease protein